jgi:hypothetical protein
MSIAAVKWKRTRQVDVLPARVAAISTPSAVVTNAPQEPAPPAAEQAADTSPSVVAPTAHPASKRTEAPARTQPSIAAELSILDGARAALASGDGRSAIAIVDRYRREVPRPSFAPEASVVRIEALAQTGDRLTALRHARRFLELYPGSPYATRVRSLVTSLTSR